MTHIDEYLVGQRNFQTIKQIKSWVRLVGLGQVRDSWAMDSMDKARFVRIFMQRFICAAIYFLQE